MNGRLFLLLAISLFNPIWLYAQYNGYKDWPREERQLGGKYLLTDEATALADKVLALQLQTGAWPKNIYYPQISAEEVSVLKKKYSNGNFGTVENNATLSEIHFLSNMFQATAQRRYRKAAEEGIQFLLNAQYQNGGWPLSFPATTDREACITFENDVMVNILQLLNRIIQKSEPYSYLSDDIRKRAQDAFNKGVACILNAQIRQEGKPTVWCARHHQETLAPACGNVAELPSLSSNHSSSIVLFLMGIVDPDPFVKSAIEGAVEWYNSTVIRGLKRENYINKEGKRDFRLVSDPHAADMWACYYTLDSNRPFFTSVGGDVIYSFDELTRERRTSVSWYSNEPQKVLRRYERWKKSVEAE